MDGKIDIFTAKQLVDAQNQNSVEKKGEPSPLDSSGPSQEIKSMQFIETLCGVCDTTVIKQGQKELMIVGLEDGTVGVLDMTGTNGQSYKRPIFKMQTENETDWNENPHSQFQELALEHQDSVVSVESNSTAVSAESSPLILSASKDGVIYIWKLEQGSEEILKYISDDDLQVPITKAKWISEKEILIATTEGKLYHFTLKLDD